MNIETLTIKVTSDGITKAKRDLDQLGTSAESTEKKVIKLVDTVDKMVKQFASSAAGTKAMTDALSVVNRSTAASDAAMKSLATSVSELAAKVSGLATNFNAATQPITRNTAAVQNHTVAMSDAHAAARGLTGSLGALWLTYGNIAPLAAGAAIGAAMKGIVTVGADVENTLENVRIKGENTVAEMAEIQKAVLEIGKGVYGPQEVAKAFETLSLAGLKAKEAVTAIGAALNLATAGGTSIENAAESLVTIGTAVGASSKEYDYLADGITKAANISLASVDSIAQAVKRASVVNKLYGASFEDILTQTAALAQLGIKNTAAGTAITNFYANSLGQTEKAKKALDSLGMSFTDATGKAKPLVDAMEEFTGKLNKFDLKSQQSLISDIFGERALRDVEGLRDQVNSLADDTSKYGNKLRETQGQVAEAAGTAALASAQLALTTQKQLESVGNTLKTTFTQVFDDLGPAVVGISSKLKEVFASKDFQTALENIATGFINVAAAIVNNIGPLTAIAEGLLAVGAITSGGALFSKLIPVVNGLAVALGSVGVAANGAAVATGLLGQAVKFLPGIGLVLGALTTAWALYSMHTEKAADQTQALANTYSGDFLKNLETEAIRLDKVNQALAKGTTLAEANTKATRDLALEKARSVNSEAEMSAQKELDKAQRNYNTAMIRDYTFDRQGSKEAKALTVAVVAANNAKAKSLEFDQKAVALADRIAKASQQQADQLKVNEATREAIAAGMAGEAKYGGTGDDKGAKKALTFLQEERLELEKVTAQYNAKTKAVWESYLTGSKIAADSRQAAVMVNQAEGKYLSNKVYLQEMSLAKAADEAKLNHDRAVAYTEIGQKITNVIEAEKERVRASSEGDIAGKLQGQIAAAGKLTSVSSEQLAIDIERAKVADQLLKNIDARAKLESAAASSNVRAADYMAQAKSISEYGSKAKSTALDLAMAKIAESKLTDASDEVVRSNLVKAASYETVAKALVNIARIGEQSADEQDKAEADSLLMFADSEKKKVQIKADSQKKIIAMNLEQARVASLSGDQRALDAYQQTYDASMKAIAQIDDTTKTKMHNVELADWKKTVDNIVDTGLKGFDTIFDKGTSIWKSLTTSIKDMFKQVVIDYIKKEFAKPILLNVIASVSGSMGMDGITNAANAMGGGGGDGTSNIGAASSMYNMLTKGFEKVENTVAGIAQKGLNAIGSSSATNFGNSVLAQSIGEYAGKAAGAAAGMQLNKMISGKYQISKGVTTVQNVATAVASYFGPEVGMIAGAVSGLLNRAFGMGPKTVQATGIRGTVGDSGTSGEGYSKWTQKGGWFRSNKSGTDTTAMGADVSNTLTGGFAALKSVSEGFAKSIGAGSNALEGFTKAFDIAFTGDATKDQEAVTKFFGTLGDEMATKLLPNIADFAVQGETASKTLERLSNVFSATNAIAAMLGKSVEQLFGSAGLGSDAVRERLVNLAGSVENLVNKTGAYAAAYLTDAEKLAPLQKALSEEMSKLGLSSVTTKDQFKNVVNGLDLTTEAGAKMFNTLMDLAPSFAQVFDAAAEAANQAADTLKEALDKALDLARSSVSSAMDSLKKSVDAQKEVLNTAYDQQVELIKARGEAEKKIAQDNLKIATDSLNSIKTIVDTLSGALKSTEVQSDSIDNARRKSAQAYLSSIRGTDLTKASGLNNAVAGVSGDSKGFFSTFEDYAMDQAKTADLLTNLNNQAGVQKTFAELTVDRLNDTITAIEDSTAQELDELKKRHEEDIARLDSIIEKAQQQIDVLMGVYTTNMSVLEAVNNLAGAMAGYAAQQSAGNGASQTDTIEGLYQSLLGRASDADGLKHWIDINNKGTSLSDIAKSFIGSDEYKKLHPFAVGTNSVPEDMPALIHKGERIIPAADNAELMRRLDGPADNESDISELRAELKELKEVVRSGHIALVQQNREQLQIWRSWDHNGLPSVRPEDAV